MLNMYAHPRVVCALAAIRIPSRFGSPGSANANLAAPMVPNRIHVHPKL